MERAFIRHTSDVLIEVSAAPGVAPVRGKGHDVSFGGLSFASAVPLERDTTVNIRIPEIDPPFEATARVAWCREEDGHFDIGVHFLEQEDAFRIRMVEQVCTIERYRKEVLEQEGRELTSGEAAQEWIGRYAARFPGKE